VLIWSIMTPVGVLVALVLASPPVASRLGVLTDPVGWARRRRQEAPTSA
jgi:hypothetical protein